jgi:hypothetical protein
MSLSINDRQRIFAEEQLRLEIQEQAKRKRQKKRTLWFIAFVFAGFGFYLLAAVSEKFNEMKFSSNLPAVQIVSLKWDELRSPYSTCTLVVKNDTQKTISALNWNFALADVLASKSTLKIGKSFDLRRGGLNIKPGEHRELTAELKGWIRDDTLWVPFVYVTRIEYADGASWNKPSNISGEMNKEMFDRGLAKTIDDSAR